MGYWDEDTLPEWIGGEMTFDDLATRILLYVIGYHQAHGRGPTYDLMATRFGRSREMIHYRLLALYDKGLVDWKYKSPGTLHPKVEVVRLR